MQIIRLNRPEKKNALTQAMYRALREALAEGDADERVRVNVLFGVPGAFCAGNDLADFLAMAEGRDDGAETWVFLQALAGARKPLVAGADGIAVGIGTTLHLHCDLSFATPRTVFRTPFVDLGLLPEAGSSLLMPLRLGHQRAFATLALGEPMSAAQARDAGLIYAVVEEEALESATLDAAARIARKPARALAVTRDLIRGDRQALDARIEEELRLFREALRGDEARAALQAFLSRKKG
jgi:enoyl-CoA hydratase/carnithine racemase